MSGEIKFKVRRGASRDKKYDYYPEWYLEIISEDNTRTNISPEYKELMKILIMCRKHELKVDTTRVRTKQTLNFIQKLEETLQEMKQTKLTEFEEKNIDDIYHNQKKVK